MATEVSGQPNLPPREVSQISDDLTEVTEYRFDDQTEKKIKSVITYKTTKSKSKMTKAQQHRLKNWKKFGECANAVGPETGITYLGDEAAFEKNIPTQEQKSEEKDKGTSFGIKCRTCGREGHFTHKCPFGNEANLAPPTASPSNQPPTSTPSPMAQPPASSSGKYVPPSRRVGAEIKTSDDSTGDRRQEAGIKVTNLPPETIEPDLYELFGKIGRVQKVTIPRTQKGESRCYAYVTFHEKEHAESALKKLHHHRYGNFVLEIELTKRN